jgi:hypothetical protein
VAGALRDLGVASKSVSRKAREAWDRAADPSWAGKAVPTRWVGGVLFVEVASSALREELAQFHAERLRAVLVAASPDLPIVGLRFVPTGGSS